MIYPWLAEGQIEAAAHRLKRRAFGDQFSTTALVDLDVILFDCLAEQDRLVFDDDVVLGMQDGDFVLGKTLPIAGKILISRDLRAPVEQGRRRFTVAHELGHWVLHRPLFLAARENLSLFSDDGDSPIELVSLNRQLFGMGYHSAPPEEWQANRFATYLLIDGEILRHAFVERYGQPPAAREGERWRNRSSSLRDHSRRLAQSVHVSGPPLAELFGLSIEAMAIALEVRGYATEQLPGL